MRKVVAVILMLIIICTNNNSALEKKLVYEPVEPKGQTEDDETFELNKSQTFSDYNEIVTDSSLTVSAHKLLSTNDYVDVDLASYENSTQIMVEYSIRWDNSYGCLIFTTCFQDNEKEIVEEFYGIPMKNKHNVDDILLNIEGTRFFLSEIEQESEVELCALLTGAGYRRICNLGFKLVAIFEPVYTLYVYSQSTIKTFLDKLYKESKKFDALNYAINYAINCKKDQPSGMLYMQEAYPDWRYGLTSFDQVGCEVAAAYNMARRMGKNIDLASTIALFEALGIEFGSAKGFFGSNPLQIYTFLNVIGIQYTKVTSPSDFEKKMNDNKNYKIILSYWTGEDPMVPLHTIFIDKYANSQPRFAAYNEEPGIFPYDRIPCYSNDYIHYFSNGNVTDLFVVAYFVEK